MHPVDVLGWELPSARNSEQALDLVAEKLSSSPPAWRRLERWVRFDPAGYARVVLYRSRRWELVVAGWLPGQRSAIHDHGRSSGAVLTLLGSLRERRYMRQGGWLAQDGLRIVSEGDVLFERPGWIHRVENASDSPAATLHVYVPPLVRMGTYGEALVVEPEAHAHPPPLR